MISINLRLRILFYKIVCVISVWSDIRHIKHIAHRNIRCTVIIRTSYKIIATKINRCQRLTSCTLSIGNESSILNNRFGLIFCQTIELLSNSNTACAGSWRCNVLAKPDIIQQIAYTMSKATTSSINCCKEEACQVLPFWNSIRTLVFPPT